MAAALALTVCLLARCAHSAPSPRGASARGQTFEEWCQSSIRRLPVFHEDVPPGGVAGLTVEKEAQLTALAAEVARVSRKAPLPPRQWAALLFTTGFHESGFSIRIHAGQCKRWECDGGRARGPFQLHKSAANRDIWEKMHGSEWTAAQVGAADQLLRRQLRTCPGMGPGTSGAGVNIEGVFAAYMGKRCASSEQTQKRMATFTRLAP